MNRAVEAVAESRSTKESRDEPRRPHTPPDGIRPARLTEGVKCSKPDDPAHLIGEEHGERHKSEVFDQPRWPHGWQGSGRPDQNGQQDHRDKSKVADDLRRDETYESEQTDAAGPYRRRIDA